MQTLNVAVIGLGVVGSGLIELLTRRRQFLKNTLNADLVLRGVADRSIDRKKPKFGKSVIVTKDPYELIGRDDIDVVVELIGGLHPAKEIVLAALKSGKHVVTANKAIISNFGSVLFRAAQSANCHLFYEASVGAGIPIIRTLTEGIAGNQINRIYGIINGTCNFILTEMEERSCSFKDALIDAQAKGYAESDPTLDINGMDTTHKIAILARLGFGTHVPVKSIYTEGIEQITAADIQFAQQLNLKIKLLAVAKRKGEQLDIRVHPTLISTNHPLASVDGVYNAIFVKGKPLGHLMLEGEGAGQMAAASGVYSDLVNLAYHQKSSYQWSGNQIEPTESLTLMPITEIISEYYIRLKVLDKPGVLSRITGILGQFNISIASFTQKEQNVSGGVNIVILTHQAQEQNMKDALSKIKQLKDVKGAPVVIRMERKQ